MSGQEPVQTPADLRQRVANRKVVVLVGAGISAGATARSPLATWSGLLEDGVRFCEEQIGGIPPGWGDRVRADIGSGDPDDLIIAAEKITRKLRTPTNLMQWLRNSVGRLHPTTRDTLEAIAALELPIMTTNYDRLLEEVTQQPSVDWQENDKVRRVLAEDEPGIVHLHGWFDRPESVVLDIRSYERAVNSTFMRSTLEATAYYKSILFVGFGSGLDDPNFSRFREWMRDALSQVSLRHYRLCRTKDLPRLSEEHQEDLSLRLLSFGEHYGELAAYLRSLAAGASGLSPGLSSAQDRPPVASVANARVESPEVGEVGRSRPLNTVTAGQLLPQQPSMTSAESVALQLAIQRITPQLLEAFRQTRQAS